MIKLGKIGAVGAAVAITAVALTGCTSTEKVEPTPAPVVTPEETQAPIGGDIVSPVSATPEELKGTTQNVIVGQVVNVLVDDPAVWTAASEDETVVKATQGEVMTAENAGMNPGFTAEKIGETNVTLTNSTTGEVVTFTIVVE